MLATPARLARRTAAQVHRVCEVDATGRESHGGRNGRFAGETVEAPQHPAGLEQHSLVNPDRFRCEYGSRWRRLLRVGARHQSNQDVSIDRDHAVPCTVSTIAA
jgi:hypothetical protein